MSSNNSNNPNENDLLTLSKEELELRGEVNQGFGSSGEISPKSKGTVRVTSEAKSSLSSMNKSVASHDFVIVPSQTDIKSERDELSTTSFETKNSNNSIPLEPLKSKNLFFFLLFV